MKTMKKKEEKYFFFVSQNKFIIFRFLLFWLYVFGIICILNIIDIYAFINSYSSSFFYVFLLLLTCSRKVLFDWKYITKKERIDRILHDVQIKQRRDVLFFTVYILTSFYHHLVDYIPECLVTRPFLRGSSMYLPFHSTSVPQCWAHFWHSPMPM